MKKVAKGEFGGLDLVAHVCNYIRSKRNNFQYSSEAKGSEYTELKSLLVAQEYLPTFFEAIGVESSGAGSIPVQ